MEILGHAINLVSGSSLESESTVVIQLGNGSYANEEETLCRNDLKRKVVSEFGVCEIKGTGETNFYVKRLILLNRYIK